MSKIKLSITALVQSLFPKSGKAISETLPVEQYNAFTAEAQEIQDRLDAQQQGNTAEQADRQQAEAQLGELQSELATAQGQVTALTDQLTQLTTDKAKAESQVTDLQGQLQQKDAYITKLKNAVNPLGEEDASNGTSAQDSLTDTDIQARANAARFKESQL